MTMTDKHTCMPFIYSAVMEMHAVLRIYTRIVPHKLIICIHIGIAVQDSGRGILVPRVFTA